MNSWTQTENQLPALFFTRLPFCFPSAEEKKKIIRLYNLFVIVIYNKWMIFQTFHCQCKEEFYFLFLWMFYEVKHNPKSFGKNSGRSLKSAADLQPYDFLFLVRPPTSKVCRMMYYSEVWKGWVAVKFCSCRVDLLSSYQTLKKKKKKCKNYLFQWMGQLIIYLLQTSSVSLLYLLWHRQLHCPKYLRRKDNWFSFRVNTKAENQNYRNLEITIVGKAKDWSNNFFF